MAWSEGELGYAAGIIDGEGCLQIALCGKNSTRLHITVRTCDDKIAPWLHQHFGGICRVHTRHGKGTPYTSWEPLDSAAEEFLRGIFYKLVLKREQARVALRFLTIKRKYSGRGKNLSPAMVRFCTSCRTQLQQLKVDMKDNMYRIAQRGVDEPECRRH